MQLTKKIIKGGNNSKRVRQSASGESSTINTLSIINYFYVSFISLILN